MYLYFIFFNIGCAALQIELYVYSHKKLIAQGVVCVKSMLQGYDVLFLPYKGYVVYLIKVRRDKVPKKKVNSSLNTLANFNNHWGVQ